MLNVIEKYLQLDSEHVKVEKLICSPNSSVCAFVITLPTNNKTFRHETIIKDKLPSDVTQEDIEAAWEKSKNTVYETARYFWKVGKNFGDPDLTLAPEFMDSPIGEAVVGFAIGGVVTKLTVEEVEELDDFSTEDVSEGKSARKKKKSAW